MEAPLKAGPQRDLDAYLQQLSTLQAAMRYLQEHDSLLAAQQAYGHAEQVWWSVNSPAGTRSKCGGV